MSFHRDLVDDDIHVITARTYADIAARDADTDFQVTANLYKVVYVVSPASVWALNGVSPTAWLDITGTSQNEFLELEDVDPYTYTGQAGKHTKVNDGETGLDFGQQLRTTDSPEFTDLTLTGDFTVQGTVSTIGTDTLLVEDKNIEIGYVATPTDVTADGGGITLKGTTDKIIAWYNATQAWTFDQIVAVTETMSIGSAAAPTTDMLLDLKIAKALGLPPVTTTEMNGLTPTERMMVYNITAHAPYFYSGSSWVSLGLGAGDVVGPASAIDNEVTRFDGTSGKVIQASTNVFIDDAGSFKAAHHGPHTFGGNLRGWARMVIQGPFASDGSSGAVAGLIVDGTLSAANGDTAWQSGTRMSCTITTQGNSETIPVISQLRVADPTITVGTGDTVTTATTFYIESAPTEGTNNYAMLVGSGESQFGGGITTDLTVFQGGRTFSTSTDTATLDAVGTYMCDDTSAARTLTISSADIAAASATKIWSFDVVDTSGGAGTNGITIDTEGAETINGASSIDILVDYGSVGLTCDGSNLFVRSTS